MTSIAQLQPVRKRFQHLSPPHLPLILLDVDGHIQHLTPIARRLLEFDEDDLIDPLFVSHVHGKNLHQISRDLDAMRRLGKQKAFWLARVRTGQGRWAWFRIVAENRLQRPERTIVLRLRDLHD
ncbi:MAG: hypothetical protein GVY18_12070 [Bacteroidetes bacterium]|jgi:PAS domain-containing protein|nr:hypothetical protein [Bacteroidota bacterium]